MPTAAASSTAGWLEQRLVDLARRDVLAALDDQLLEAPGDEVEAVRVAIVRDRRCAASHPARAWPRSARAPCSSPPSRSARAASARPARRRRAACTRDPAGRSPSPRRRTATRACRTCAARRPADWRTRPRPIRSCRSSRSPGCRRSARTRGAARAAAARTRSGRSALRENRVARGWTRRAFKQVGDDRRHHVDPRASIRLDVIPPRRDAEALRRDEAAAGDERRHRGDHLAVDVIERQRRTGTRSSRRQSVPRRDAGRRGEQVAVARAARLSACPSCPTCT